MILLLIKSVIKNKKADELEGVAARLFTGTGMIERVVRTNNRVAAERQIHATIAHFRAGDFECAITLSHAAEGRLPQPSGPTDLLSRLKRLTAKHHARDGQKDDFNFFANWLKHEVGPDEIEIVEWLAKMWLCRATSRYRAAYGIGTSEMAALFPWAEQATMHSCRIP